LETEINLQIILVQPPPNVLFGLQKGSGNNYETLQKQKSGTQDLLFIFPVKIKGEKGKDSFPKFSGGFVQGPAGGKFVYIDIGNCAGQIDTIWSRRLKVPLTGITWELIEELIATPTLVLETKVPGTGKDGGPNCATVKPFEGWHIK
jgi:Family of unknown function (DUF5990)